MGSFTILSLQDYNQPIADGVHDSPKQDFGAPIYDEYKDDYWGGMPKRNDAYLINIGPDKERDMVPEIKASLGISGTNTLCQGEGFSIFVEEGECTLTRASLKDESLVPEAQIQEHFVVQRIITSLCAWLLRGPTRSWALGVDFQTILPK